ncbi:MAG: isovaleryl-CoA dehydrogenase [Bdellovibrionales bacterium]|nr:isovaleryl-CoA dehydrogenase [Bdellovibrionales bacterium]MBT3525629.1 isovaleryl-CoA dehydrogenase [Bdellovibrionales bacterium]
MWFFTDEERELKEVCHSFAQNELAPSAAEHDENESFNLDAFKKMGELGLLGITADPEYGGSGLGACASTIVMEEFGAACASSTLSYLAHTILTVNNINNNASPEQKERFLPKLISGEWIGCMGMSEPEHGSDALGIETKAVKQGDYYLINGTKMWITNAEYSDIAYIYARTGEKKKDISTFIVEKGCEGFSTAGPIHKLGMRASPTGELIFDNAKIPVSNIVGNPGDSTYHMLKNLEMERITISGISLGIANACVDQSLRYANERKQFGRPIGDFQMIQRMIAEMVTERDMMKHFLYSVTKEYDQGKKGPTVAAEIKLALPKMATKIALDTIQLMGGYGYSREFPAERYLRDSKLNEIGAGTNEIMVLIIAKNMLKKYQNQ